MPNNLLISISPKADLIVTPDNQLAVAPGLLSDVQETIVIGPINDQTIEHFIYALQYMRIHT